MPITIGSYVRIKHQAAIGEVVAIDLPRVLIAVEKLHLYLPIQSVERVELPVSMRIKASPSPQVAMRAPLLPLVDPILDLHGFNKAQALLALEKFIDRSLVLGHSRLKVIHGQGKGILRSAVRGYLKAHPLVKSVTLQSPIHCMSGMTIVEM